MFIDLLSNEGLFVIIKHEYEYCEWVVNNIYMNDYTCTSLSNLRTSTEWWCDYEV